MKILKYIFLLLLIARSFGLHAQHITSGEYFWDADPGQGNGIAMTASDGNLDSVIEAVALSTLSLPSTGDHILNVRVKDDNNLWGPVFRTVIHIDSSLVTVRQIKVTAAEYFWDTDPGAGNGIAMVAFDGAFDSAVETAYQSGIGVPGTLGVHTFSVRVLDAENNWGPVFKTVINIDSSLLTVRQIKVAAAEYFWDADPGQGNGNAMVAFDGAFDSAVETAYQSGITPPAVGVHTFSVRVLDAELNWGPVFTTVINVDSSAVTQRQIKVTAGEYFFDTDPGAGNATPMLALDGTFDEALETLIGGNIPPVVAGIHVLFIRARDAQNNWGPKFGIVVNMDSTITTSVPQLSNNIPRIEIYPNPFSNEVTIEINSDVSETAEIRVTDMTGRIVKELRSNSSKVTIDGSSLASGIYFATILKGKDTVVKKIVKDN